MIIWYILGLLLTGCAGFMAAALLSAAGRVDEYERGFKDGYDAGKAENRQ